MPDIPEGFHTLTPHLVVTDGAGALAHYVEALGATETMRMPMPDGSGKLMHACMQMGSSKLFLCDESPEQGMFAPKNGAPGANLYMYVDDVDATYEQAVASGMNGVSPPSDMFWGDRLGTVIDKFGHRWTLSTHVRDVSEEDMAAAMAQMAAG